MDRRISHRPFLKRERDQGAHLARALLGRHQRVFNWPEFELANLDRRGGRDLGSLNLYARRWWLQALFRHLPYRVLAHGRLFAPTPVYLLTILDQRQVWKPDYDDPRYADPTIRAVREAYGRHLRGLDALGMIDAALYVSVQRIFGINRLIHLHLHALVWNIDEDELRAHCEAINAEIRPLLGYASAAEFRLVKGGDLQQVLWYVAKAPRKQYQLYQKDNGRLRQYKRAINGVNAVRLYAELGRVSLEQLTLGSGEGHDLLQRVQRDLQRWRLRPSNISRRPRAVPPVEQI